jgi:hypothetical protein
MSGTSAGAEQDDYQDQLEQQQQNTYAAPAPAAPAYAPPTQAIPLGSVGHAQQVIANFRAQHAAAPAGPQERQDADGAEPFSAVPPTPPASKQGLLKDAGDAVWAGVLDLDQGMAGAAAFANQQLGNDPAIAAYIANRRAVFADHTAATIAGMSASGQAAMHASLFNDGSDPTNAPTWGQAGYARTAAMSLAGMVPQIALAVLPASIVSKAAVKIASLAGAGADVAATATAPAVAGAATRIGQAAGTATTATAFGTQDAGQAWNAIVDQVDKATPDDMKDDPAFQHIAETNPGMSFEQQKAELLKTPGLAANIAMHFATGAVAGAGVGELVGGAAGVAGKLGTGVASKVAGGLEGAAVMGGQSAADDALSQKANQAIGTQQGGYQIDETLKAGLSGALGGAVLGAGGAMLHGGAEPAKPPEPTRLPGPEAATVAPDVSAALNEQLSLDLKQPPPPPSVGAAPGSQGEMFPSAPPGPRTQPTEPLSGAPPTTPTPGLPPTAAQSGLDLQHAPPGPGYPPGSPQGEMFPATPVPAKPDLGITPGVAPGASQPDLAMRQPPVAPDPRLAATPGAQGEMFRDQATTPPAEPTPAPVASAPAPTTPAAPVTRLGLLKALVAAGEDQKSLARLKIPDLQRRLAALSPDVTPGVVDQGGRTNTTAVNDPGVASAVEPRAGVLTSSGEQATAPSSERLAPPVSEPARVAAKPETSEAPTVADNPATNPVSKVSSPALTKGEQLRADAQAKRALAKAKLAKPGEKITTGAHVDLKSETVSDLPTYDHAATATKVREAATKAARSEGLPSGVIDGWVRDVSNIISGAHSEANAHDLLAEWGDKPGPVTGAKVQRSVVADKMMKLLNYKGETARERLGREARDVASSQGSVYENEGVARRAASEDNEAGVGVAAAEEAKGLADVGDHVEAETEGSHINEDGSSTVGEAEERSQGVVDHSAMGEKERSAETTDKTRILSDLEHKIRNEGMSIAEADAQYGKQQGPGRRRAYPDVSSWVRERIATEEDPTTKAHLVEALAKHEDPVGTATQAEIANQSTSKPAPLYRRAAEDALTPESSRYAQAVHEPRLNSFIPEQIQAREASGTPYTLHEGLDAIVQHATGPDSGPMRDLAAKIRQWAPNVPVRSEDLGEGVAGVYRRNNTDRTRSDIAINPNASDHVQTLLHEGLHTVTSDHIDHLLREDPNHPELQALRAIGDELRRHGVSGGDSAHVLSNEHEIHTTLMTDPEWQKMAASIPASPEFRAKMRDLGFPPREQGRSIWQGFKDWVRRAVGLPKVASASEDTLLDHVMRPLQDITDRAVEHNASMLTKDPVLRAQAEPLYRVASTAMGKAHDAIMSRLEPSAIMDHLRPATLSATTTDAMVGRYRSVFDQLKNFTFSNPLVRVRDAGEAIAHRAKQFADAHSDQANNLVSMFNARPDHADIARLMNDATIGDAKLGTGLDPAANAHMKTPEQKATLAALKARYDALPAESRAVYDGYRDYYAKTGAEERAAELKGVLGRVFPDASEAQREAFGKMARTPEGLEKFLADPDNSELAKTYGAEFPRQRAMSVGIAKVLNAGRVQGDYFPLARFGDHVVRYGVKGEDSYGIEMFEKKADALARHAELAAQGVDDLHQVDLKDTSSLREITRDHPMINEVENALRGRDDLREHADAVRDIMNKIVLQASTRSDVARVRRQGIQGASLEAARVLARDAINTGTRIGYLEHGSERFKALSDMRLVAGDLARNGEPGQAIQARQVLSEIEKKVTAQENPGGVMASATRVANSFGYVQSLMSFSHILTSSIETHMNSTSLLGARHGARATLALTKALADVTPALVKAGARNTMKGVAAKLKAADWDLSKVARDSLVARGANATHMDALFDAMDRAGLVDHSMTRELRRIANPSGVVANRATGYFQRFTDFMGAGAHAADVANKSAVAKAAFDLEMRKSGNDVGKSVNYAMETLRQTTPNYNLANKTRISTSAGALGAFAAPITQFKQYGFHMYGVMGNLVKASISGATREERLEARKAFAGVLVTHAMMAGSLTLIADPLRYIGGLYDFFTGASKPHDYENDSRSWLASTFGPEVGEVLARGLPHLLGMDVHRRVGIGNLLEIPGLNSFDKKGAVEMLGTAMVGAAGEDAGAFMDGFHKVFNGDMSGLKDVVPRPVRDVMKAIGLANTGVTDSRGKVGLPAAKLSPYDVTVQALGFQPSKVSEYREGKFAVQEAQDEAKGTHGKLTQAWLGAQGDDRAAVMSQIRVFNRANPGMRITVDGLIKQMVAARKASAAASANPAGFGVKMNPAQTRTYAPAGAFANVGG